MIINDKQIHDWILNKIENEYSNDISILVGHSAYVLPSDQSSYSIDFFVPATQRGIELAKTFIIDGIGCDLYYRTWDKLEDMAALKDYSTVCLAYAKILYARTEAERARFLKLQETLRDNLKDQQLTYYRALENLNVSMQIYQNMLFEISLGKVKMAAGTIADYIINGTAYMNHMFIRHEQDSLLKELEQMSDQPENLASYYRLLMKSNSADELCHLSHLMILKYREFLFRKNVSKTEPNSIPSYAGLASWYEELSYTFRRIYYYCDEGDISNAFYWCVSMQQEFNIVCEEFKLQDMDLMGYFDISDLSGLKIQAEILEENIRKILLTHDVKLEEYETVEDFIRSNS